MSKRGNAKNKKAQNQTTAALSPTSTSSADGLSEQTDSAGQEPTENERPSDEQALTSISKAACQHCNSSLFHVGNIVAAHSLDGTVKVRILTNNPRLLTNIHTVTVELPGGITQKGKIRSLQFEKNALLLRLHEIKDRNMAEELIGGTVHTPRTQIAKLEADEWWISDLVGLTAYTVEGRLIGTICDVITGGNELLEIRKAGDQSEDTILVPFVKALVPVVDVPGGKVVVVNLSGLLD